MELALSSLPILWFCSIRKQDKHWKFSELAGSWQPRALPRIGGIVLPQLCFFNKNTLSHKTGSLQHSCQHSALWTLWFFQMSCANSRLKHSHSFQMFCCSSELLHLPFSGGLLPCSYHKGEGKFTFRQHRGHLKIMTGINNRLIFHQPFISWTSVE